MILLINWIKGRRGINLNRMCISGQFVQQKRERILVNPEWIIKFLEAKVSHLPRTRYYHCPLLLSLSQEIIVSVPIDLLDWKSFGWITLISKPGCPNLELGSSCYCDFP